MSEPRRYEYVTVNGEVEGWTYDNYANWIDSLYRVVGMTNPSLREDRLWWEIADRCWRSRNEDKN